MKNRDLQFFTKLFPSLVKKEVILIKNRDLNFLQHHFLL
ncbi:Uncharacterised protein [Actinobacillus pleuropneumoniae]|nr:Uncharacterised protein [Actinobacillus pleuropneumoniae]